MMSMLSGTSWSLLSPLPSTVAMWPDLWYVGHFPDKAILYKLLNVIYESEEYIVSMNTFTAIGVSQIKEADCCREGTGQ